MRAAGAVLLVLLAAGCRTTTDSLGSNPSQINPDATVPIPDAGPPDGAGGDSGTSDTTVLHPITKPASYPKPLQEVLGLSDATVMTRINSVYQQLFHGTQSSQAIYWVSASDPTLAYIQDVLHGQQRTEGQGLGMMIAVELNHQNDFDPLWRYAKARMEVTTGANAGYFNSYCDDADQMGYSMCLDPFGFEQFVTALIFAHHRWGSTGAVNYQKDALALFHTMKHKVEDNGGVGMATNLFDPTAHLPYAFPDTSNAGMTRPSIVMPGYYAVWAQADADDTFLDAVTQGRALIQNAAWPTTGLTPIKSYFTGKPVPGWDMFQPEAYRAQINVVVDQIWTGGTPENVTFANKLLAFFASSASGGINNYGTSYELDGTPGGNPIHELSLVVSNGIAAGIATSSNRGQFLSAFWNMPTQVGQARYYTGLLQLWGLLILSGNFQIY
ncbi:MAG TPA: glycosyl hydrolase family 8 [Polyangia bacterium]|nr:glycosyl hydrolase family 8 [Polyangia bacterium]